VADTDVEVRVSKPLDRRNAPTLSPSRSEALDAAGGPKSVDSVDRRRHARYRFSEPMKICCPNGAYLEGMSVELSESGMSAMIQGTLAPGDVVRLQPVTGVTTAAVVRHKLGMLYGFEFLELAREQAGKIADRCRRCEPWRSNARVV
jgi:PilZ domain